MARVLVEKYCCLMSTSLNMEKQSEYSQSIHKINIVFCDETTEAIYYEKEAYVNVQNIPNYTSFNIYTHYVISESD